MKRLKLFKKMFEEKIHWTKTSGLSKDKSRFAVDFVSNPLSQETFDKIGGKFIKQIFGDAEVIFIIGQRYVFSQEVLDKNQLVLKLALPKLTVGNFKVLSKKVVGITYELTKNGWIITQEVEGTLKV